ncbi:MAG: hypothetical protein P8R42_04735 [Candidatus Binatia bacterium]|nr:hypothetical protein [Candidatus Binatia bacterium]
MPISDFGSHDPEFTRAQKDACARIIDAVRALNTKVVRLSGSVAELNEAADHIEQVTASLDPVTASRAIETFHFEFDPNDPNRVMPFNPATGAMNPMAPKIVMRLDGDTLVGEFAFPSNYESGPDIVQGGMVAAFYDQLLAFAVMSRGRTGPTLWIRVSYLKRTPIEQPLRFEAQVVEIDGDNYLARGVCYLGDTKVSEAEAAVLGKLDMPLVGQQAE